MVKKELTDIAMRKIPLDNNIKKRSEWSEQDIEYWNKRRILVRNIVDYIAGMTDSYAINEFNSILHNRI